MALIVRMVKGQRVRHVPSKSVGKMRQNGWTVAESETLEMTVDEAKFFLAGAGDEEPPPEDKPPPKRQRKSKPSETDSEGLSLPEYKEGNS